MYTVYLLVHIELARVVQPCGEGIELHSIQRDWHLSLLCHLCQTDRLSTCRAVGFLRYATYARDVPHALRYATFCKGPQYMTWYCN